MRVLPSSEVTTDPLCLQRVEEAEDRSASCHNENEGGQGNHVTNTTSPPAAPPFVPSPTVAPVAAAASVVPVSSALPIISTPNPSHPDFPSSDAILNPPITTPASVVALDIRETLGDKHQPPSAEDNENQEWVEESSWDAGDIGHVRESLVETRTTEVAGPATPVSPPLSAKAAHLSSSLLPINLNITDPALLVQANRLQYPKISSLLDVNHLNARLFPRPKPFAVSVFSPQSSVYDRCPKAKTSDVSWPGTSAIAGGLVYATPKFDDCPPSMVTAY